MIAMAVACDPKVLIADEPTTALDVTIQAGILDVLRELRERLGTSIVLITHDLGVVADLADRVAVMYAGRVVETAEVHDLFAHPQHPYTAGLLGASPAAGRHAGTHRLNEIPGLVPVLSDQPDACTFADRCPRAVDTCTTSQPDTDTWSAPSRVLEPGQRTSGGPMTDLALEVEDLVMHFGPGPGRRRRRHCGSGKGSVVALVGESGSGKSTVGRCIVRLLEPTGGTVRLADADITHLNRRQLRPHRRDVSIVFQDPAGSLDPRLSVGDIVGEPLRLMRRQATSPQRSVPSRCAGSDCARRSPSAHRTSCPAVSGSGSASPAH